MMSPPRKRLLLRARRRCARMQTSPSPISVSQYTHGGRHDCGQCNAATTNIAFVVVAAGALHSLGLRADGSIVAWGATDQVPVPNTGFVAVAGSWSHSLGGRRVARTAPRMLGAGRQSVAWDGRDANGIPAGRGFAPVTVHE